jgi:VWFA-related protein
MGLKAVWAILIPTFAAWPQAPEITSQQMPFTFSSRVNLVSVPVVVRDRDGRAVGTLRKEDFQLLDKGKPQVISKFSVQTAGGAAPQTGDRGAVPATNPLPLASPVLPERYVAYLFDDIHLQRGDLLITRETVKKHLEESLDSTTRAAIFTTSGVMLSDFTADLEQLRKAIDRVLPWSSGPDPRQDCPPMSYYMADLLVNKLLYLDGFLFSDQQLAAMISNGTADEALIAMVAETKQCAGLLDPWIVLRTAAHRNLTYGDHETASALGALRDVVRRLTAAPGNRNLVLVSPGFLLTRDHRLDEYDLLDRAIRANVVVNTIDMRGLYTPVAAAGDLVFRTQFAGYLQQAELTAASDADNVLGEVADGTGGRFFHSDNDLKAGLNRLAARPEYVYVLGFSPQELKLDGSYHALKVTVRNSANFTIEARRGYWAPRHAVDPAEAAREEIQEAVFTREEIRDIPVDVHTEFFKSSDVKAELTVTARLNPTDFHFRKADERSHDTVTVVTGLFDSDGNYISGIQRVVAMHLRDQTLAALSTAGIAVKETFQVAPGRYVVRLVVRDAEGRNMAGRNQGIDIP